eukprot:1188002-Prorocentrum_minimum.AAC.1
MPSPLATRHLARAYCSSPALRLRLISCFAKWPSSHAFMSAESLVIWPTQQQQWPPSQEKTYTRTQSRTKAHTHTSTHTSTHTPRPVRWTAFVARIKERNAPGPFDGARAPRAVITLSAVRGRVSQHLLLEHEIFAQPWGEFATAAGGFGRTVGGGEFAVGGGELLQPQGTH